LAACVHKAMNCRRIPQCRRTWPQEPDVPKTLSSDHDFHLEGATKYPRLEDISIFEASFGGATGL